MASSNGNGPALPAPGGRVKIAWKATVIAGGKQINLFWTEERGPPAVKPERHGFGTRLLTMSAEQLGGGIEIGFEPGGAALPSALPAPSQ